MGAVTLFSYLMLAAGLALLIVGADVLVRGAARLATAFGVPALVVGLTVVAFGTSAPETLVSIQAALQAQPEIALGNVVGSNIFNVLFILGISALITPLAVSRGLVRRDVPIMIAASGLVILLGLNGRLGRFEGLFMVALLVVYTGSLVRGASRQQRSARADARTAALEAGKPVDATRRPTARLVAGNILLILLGLGMLGLGADWLVDGAVRIATALGLSELVIGLTIVAAGTSLPEVAASVAASLRGERDIAVGNIVGSNIFNVLLVLGAAAVVSPAGLRIPPAALTFDLPVMTAVAVACLPVFFTDMEIARWEGAVFLGYYVAYTAFLVLDATGHEAAPLLGSGLLFFVVPITVITLAALSVRALGQRRRTRREG